MAANPCRKGMLIVGRVQGGPCVECAHGCVRWAWRRGEGRGKRGGKRMARRRGHGAGVQARKRRCEEGVGRRKGERREVGKTGRSQGRGGRTRPCDEGAMGGCARREEGRAVWGKGGGGGG